MANEEQLAILRQGVDVWNVWRMEHPSRVINLFDADLHGADLHGADLHGANLPLADLTGADLTGAHLTGAHLIGAHLFNANLGGANLGGAGLEEANLHRASLFDANLEEANLHRADLDEANLRGANLRGANLRGAGLYGVNLRGANLHGTNVEASIIGWTVFVDVDLRGVQGLDMVQHWGPSSIGIDTLYRSQGNIPEVFLRGCGVPDPMIEYARSLVLAARPIDYYSCFISYSSNDQDCAERLHTDLQGKGVRCWFAPHDLEIGVPIVRGIGEAIRLYDKLLLILSESSVTSGWVEFEVNQALTRENVERRTMLFPIRLDDTVLHTPSGWAAQLRSRHIGDFRGWKDHDLYQARLTQLLRDLVADDRRKR